MSFFCIYLIDKRTNIIIRQYIDVEVERLTNNIVNKAVHEKIINSKVDYNNLLIIKKNNDGLINNISYDTNKINYLENEVVKDIQDKLNSLDDGKIDDYFILNRVRNGRFKKLREGILCDISIGSVRDSLLFGNIGPTIPIKLVFASQVNSDIDIEVKEYGINNVMVKVYLVINIKEQVSMPITSKRKEIVVKEPIAIDIIKGDIPSYYNGLLK